jgi:hypothetical protein
MPFYTIVALIILHLESWNKYFLPFFLNLDVESLCCEVCELAKHKHASFSLSNKVGTSPFYLIHTNVWGPSIVPNISGARWFVTFIDDCMRVTRVYLLRQKSEVTSGFLHFFSMVKKTSFEWVLRVRYDNVKDYFNHELIPFAKKRVLFMSPLVSKHPNKMGLLIEKIGTC